MDNPKTPAQRGSRIMADTETGATEIAFSVKSERLRLDQSLHPLPTTRNSVLTPHAVRALKQKLSNTGAPARERRKSERLHRQTPREGLRNLSRSMINY